MNQFIIKVAIFIAVILIILVISYVSSVRAEKKWREANRDIYIPNLRDREYRSSIYNQVTSEYRPIVRQIYDNVDQISGMMNTYNRKLDEQTIRIADEILNKARDSERKIGQRWETNRAKLDFYYYINLHYASFMLADQLYQELKNLREYEHQLTIMINKEQKKIDSLAHQIKSNNSPELKRKHQECCRKCDALRKTRKSCIEQKNLYAARVHEQNRITAKRRDYIGTHCGKRGKLWRKRILANHKRRRRTK
ncbi:MAG: hypothetical protein LUC90_09240 [Lachnospiraceae bacterium]|nr:hypothetical protein [Lachnospiraceae bacterium]